MKCVIIFAALAMIVLSASATPCTDICNGYCGGVTQVCDLTMILGPLCDTQFNICAKGCGLVCVCVDKCYEQCSTELNTCRADAGTNLIALGSCDVNFTKCQAVCGGQCAIDTAVGALTQTLGGAGK